MLQQVMNSFDRLRSKKKVRVVVRFS